MVASTPVASANGASARPTAIQTRAVRTRISAIIGSTIRAAIVIAIVARAASGWDTSTVPPLPATT